MNQSSVKYIIIDKEIQNLHSDNKPATQTVHPRSLLALALSSTYRYSLASFLPLSTSTLANIGTASHIMTTRKKNE
jgi:hypothetical protein